MVSILFFATAIGLFAWLTLSRAGKSEAWSAAVAPLASIIGSGFLISAPLLGRLLGGYAPLGMAALLLLAAGFGGAVRHNISRVEMAAFPPRLARWLDRLSELALIFAYLVSVAYYLSLLAAFVTRLAFGAPDRVLGPWIATALIALIAGLGWSGGLLRVIKVEAKVVAVKLAIISGFLAALAWGGFERWSNGGAAAMVPLEGHFEASAIPVLLGLLIVVQGFETSRYLGEEFDAETRIRTMRLAQNVAAAIYLTFFVLMLPLLPETLDVAGETAIIDAAAAVGAILPLMLTIGAVASQFSAAVADAIGGSGLVSEIANHRMKSSHAFPLLGVATIAIVWSTDIFGVITLASKAFALYYMLQCLVAAAEVRARQGVTFQAVWYFALGCLAALVLMVGVPAE